MRFFPNTPRTVEGGARQSKHFSFLHMLQSTTASTNKSRILHQLSLPHLNILYFFFRNCTYPQHLTLQLEHPSRLQQVQLLSHEFKIAGKVELQVAPPPSSPRRYGASPPLEFTRLGFLNFDANERTQFSARELKSVTLQDVEATAIRLIIHRCHANTLNTYSQACLIMLNFVGESLVQQAAASMPTGRVSSQSHRNDLAVPVVPSPPIAMAASNNPPGFAAQQLEEGVDAVTAQRIAELQARKSAAVAIEDYDEAKRLKAAVDRLRSAGSKMAVLETRKKAAVDVEDYDTAKALKIELDRMRNRLYSGSGGGDTPTLTPYSDKQTNLPYDQQGGGVSGNYNHREGGQRASTLGPSNLDGYNLIPARHAAHDMMSGGDQDGMQTPIMQSPMQFPGDRGGGNNNNNFSRGNGGGGNYRTISQQREEWEANNPGGDWKAYDERPARAKGAYDLGSIEQLDARTPPPGAAPLRRIDENAATIGGVAVNTNNINNKRSSNSNSNAGYSAAAAASQAPPLPVPPGFPSELPQPEPLSSDDQKESGPMEDLVGEFLTRCLYSKTWQLREAGMTTIAHQVGNNNSSSLPGLDGNSDAMRLLISTVVAPGLKARIPAIAAAALTLLRCIVSSASDRKLQSRDLQAALGEVLPAVAERAADPAPRSRDLAIEALVEMAKIKESGMKSLCSVFLRPIKKGESPKATLGRLQLVSALLSVLGVSESMDGGFSAESTVRFTIPALISANAEVRSAGADLVVKIGKDSGMSPESVLSLVPGDVNPKLREQIQADLNGERKVRPPSSGAVRPGVAGGSRRPSSSKAATGNGDGGLAGGVGANGVNRGARTSKNEAAAVAGGGNSAQPTPRGRAGSTSGPAGSTRNGATGQQQQQQQQQQRRPSASAAASPPAKSKARDRLNRSPQRTARRQGVHFQAPGGGGGPGGTGASGAAAAIPHNDVSGRRSSHSVPNQHPPQHPANTPFDPSSIPSTYRPPNGRETGGQSFEPGFGVLAQVPPPPPPLYAEDTSTTMMSLHTDAKAEFSVLDEDPAPFEDELRRREATLGLSHPAVAEAASNLAIIYNQRGDSGAALPLYQKALRIWESTYGPQHPEVAHALTDIAVILLEAGHDAEGKHLLRRALDIQMPMLGPEHPDVIAIRDVLEEGG